MNSITLNKRNEPLSLFDTFFDNRFNRIFDSFWHAPIQHDYGVEVTDKEYIISLEIPGFKKNDVTVEVKNNTLYVVAKTIKAKVSRSFSYTDWNPELGKAQLEDGILTVTVPRQEQTSKVLEVQ